MANQTPIIVVANHKGGVGKTTIASHLAAGLALHGYNVALVDTDPQGHVCEILGMDIPDWRNPNAYALYHLLTNDEINLSDVLMQAPADRYSPDGTAPGNLYILPSNKHSSMIVSAQSSPARFRHRLEDMAELLDLDYIVVDTAPTHSMFDGSILLAVTHYLYVTEPSALSFAGLNDSISELDQINREYTGLRENPITMLGIVPNKVRGNTANHRENLKALARHFTGVVTTPIMLRTRIEEATEYKQLIYGFAPGDPEYHMMHQLVEQLIDRMEAHG